MLFEKVIHFISLGGTINWIITGFYFLIFTVTLERIIYFLLSRCDILKLEKQLGKIKNTEKKSDQTLVLSKYCYLTPLVGSYLDNLKKNQKFNEFFEEKIEETGIGIISRMEKFLWLLSESGHIAPLLGLLGTITGLIRAFAKIASAGGDVDVSAFSGGIWEAMLTTANGLIVAIPAFLIYRIFEEIVESRKKRMNRIVVLLNERFHKEIRELAELSDGLQKEDLNYEVW